VYKLTLKGNKKYFFKNSIYNLFSIIQNYYEKNNIFDIIITCWHYKKIVGGILVPLKISLGLVVLENKNMD
jgi:hypothetical protein